MTQIRWRLNDYRVKKVEPKSQQPDDSPWLNDDKYKRLKTIRYERLDRKQFPLITEDEKQHGEVLFPRDTLIYEVEIPAAHILFINFSVEGTLSRRHLFHYKENLTIPAAFDKTSNS